jgi:MFS family permease
VALRVPNFRIYLVTNSFSRIGTWMQSTALDWLVLQLTDDPVAVGVVMALQFLPILLFGMHGGMIADRCAKRVVLVVTQGLNCLLGTALAVLTITGHVQVAHLYAFAFLAGLVFAVDSPTRQVFVNEVVPAPYVHNSIALNSATFHFSRLLGPALAAAAIGTVGTGWVFAANAAGHLVLVSGLLLIRGADLVPAAVADRHAGRLRDALRHVAARPEVLRTMVLVAVIGTFGLNFPVVLTVMASSEFGGGLGLYGLFNVVLAAGSVVGALLAGRGRSASPRTVVVLAAAFGLTQVVAAVIPALGAFLVALVGLGLANLAFQTTANSSVQASVDPGFRGRVMGLYMLVFVGGTPLGGPVIGLVTAAWGPRVGMAVCGTAPLVAVVVVVLLLRRARDRSR